MNLQSASPSQPAWTRWLAVAGLAACVAASAAQGAASYVATPNQPVPDDNSSGLVSVLNLPADAGRILDVDLTLTLAGRDFGGWNGDLYILLAHGGTASVLANRPGFTAGDAFGYGDNGLLDLRFDDEAAAGDFHLYQALGGAPADPSLPVTGLWQPDGRGTDPDLVLDSDPRTLFLDEFDGLDAAGEWRLFVADLSRGSTFQLVRWELHLTTEPLGVIPEASTGLAMGSIAALVGLHLWVRRSRRSAAR